MTERASDLLSELADRLSGERRRCRMVAAEAIRAIEPELLQTVHETASAESWSRPRSPFLEILFRSLRPDSHGALARVLHRWPARRPSGTPRKGVPLESLMEGLAVFRRSVIARVTDELDGSPYADEVLLLAQSRLGATCVEHLNSSFIRGYLDYTEAPPSCAADRAARAVPHRQRAGPFARRDRDRRGRPAGNAQGARPAGRRRLGARGRPPQAREDDRHAAG